MKQRVRTRWSLLALLMVVVAAVAMVAAACGGGDDNAADTSGGAGTAAKPVSGSISIAGIWTGDEQASFQAVIDGFTAKNPDAKVKYTSAGNDLPTVLTTALQGGNPPDIATIAQPGTIRDYAKQGVLKPLDFARDTIDANFSTAVVNLASVDGKIYGVLFKAANKSLVWYNVPVWADAGVKPPENWEDLPQVADTIKASGVTPYSIGADVGWPLTDLFENIYLRTAGGEMYDKLAAHQIPWTDPSVIEALKQMKVVIGTPGNIAGGTRNALQTDFPGSVTQVFSDPPKASMLFEGDFVRTNIENETKAKPETGFNVFPFPAVNGSPPAAVGAGDIAVMFKDSPVAEAFITYLATPEAAQIWAERGGLLSANKNLDPSVYPDDITRTIGTQLQDAGDSFRFDLSDLQPPAFGATTGQGEWKIFTDYLRDPSNPQAIASQLEAAAKKAYQ